MPWWPTASSRNAPCAVSDSVPTNESEPLLVGFTNTADGRLTLSVAGTNETWTAAINRSYDTLVLIDDVVENRSNFLPELNLVVGVRKKVN